jgi:hypothetical protein
VVCQHYAMVMKVKCQYLIYSYTIAPLVVKKSWEINQKDGFFFKKKKKKKKRKKKWTFLQLPNEP